MATRSLGSGVVVLMLDNVVTIAVSSADVDGAYCLVDVTAPAGGGSPVLHTHPAGECFYVVDGTLTVYRETIDGGLEELELAAGRSAYIPSGAIHTFCNRGDGAARFVVVSEGDLMERFFLAAGVAVADPGNLPALDPELLGEAAARARAAGESLGFSFLGPVPVGVSS